MQIKNWRVLTFDPETFGPNEMEGPSTLFFQFVTILAKV